MSKVEERIPLAKAERVAEGVKRAFSRMGGVLEVIIAGSIRRRRETVGDIDMVIITDDGEIPELPPNLGKVLMNGKKMSAYALPNGRKLEVKAFKPSARGSALLFCTGSGEYNVLMRSRAKSMGLKLNQYGLFKGDVCVASETEESIFSALGMNFVSPEKREKGFNPKKDAEYVDAVVKGSTGDEYTIQHIDNKLTCSCKGFFYRGDCRHIREFLRMHP